MTLCGCWRSRAHDGIRDVQWRQHVDTVQFSVASKARIAEDFTDLSAGITSIQASITKWQREVKDDHTATNVTSKARLCTVCDTLVARVCNPTVLLCATGGWG